jgi:hypothetical protein
VLCVICCEGDDDALLVRPTPLVVPPLASRAAELDRVIAEYAEDAIALVCAQHTGFTAADHAGVRENAASSLAEIEKGTLRLVAIRMSRNMSAAAARLEMAPVSLSRWLDRRRHGSSRRAAWDRPASANPESGEQEKQGSRRASQKS